MSVIIRLQNLPWSANALDIRQYFQGLSIPEGGVHIVGGELGDAFIAFSTDEDARQAMLIDGGKIKEVKIKLFLSSRSEMQKVIETARAQSISMQTFMQLPPAQIPSAPVPATQIPPTPSQTAPAMPPISQMPVKTPEIKPPPLPVETPAPETIKSEHESEKKDQDTESVSSKDTKRGRRGRSRSKSKDRSKSRSRSRDRNYRSKDRYRDRRRRDRSRSRDRRDRRRYRDRSRSRDRNARKVSRDRRRDPDRNDQNSSEIIINTNDKKTVPQKEVESTIPPMPSKPGFSNSGWVSAGSTAEEISGSPLTNPIGFSIGKPPLNSASNQTQSPKSEISTSLKIPLPQQSLPLHTPQQMPTSQSDTISQPIVLPQPPPFPQMPLELPKNESGQLKSIPFPPNQPQSSNPLTTQHGTMFPPIQPPLLQSEANKVIPGPPFMMPPGWNPNMLPMVGNPHLLLGSMPPPMVGINNADKPPMPMMNVPMGMYMRPPALPSSESVQPPHLQNDPRVQSGFNMQQQRNEFSNNNSVPQNNNFNSQKQPNFAEERVNTTNQRNTFFNASVEIRNMSMSTTNIDIRRFFQGLQIPADGVKIITDKKGNKVGMAYVRFSKSFFKDMALKKSGQLLKNSVVEVLHIDDSIFDKASDYADYPGNFYKDNQNYKGNFDSFVASNEPTEPYTDLTIHDVPPFAKDRDIYNLFKGFNIEDAFVLLRTGRKTATGYVRFRTPAEARRAMATSSRLSIGYTNVKVAICYEHEFSEARDRKNMEEVDEEMMDSKDGGSYTIHENRGPRGSKKHSSYDYEEEESNSKYNQFEKRPYKPLLPTPHIKPFDQRPSLDQLGNQSNNSHSFNSRYDRRQQDSSRTSKDFHKKPYTREDFHQQAHIKESSRFQTRQPPRDEFGGNRYSIGDINKKSSSHSNFNPSFQDQSRKPLVQQPPLNTPSATKDVKEPTVSLKATPVNAANTVSNEKEVKEDETNQSEADNKDVKQKTKSPKISSTAPPDIQKLLVEEITEPKQMEKASDEAQQTLEKKKQINFGTDCIILQGLPFNANDRDILDFFSDEGLVPTQIHIMLDKLGQPAGDAFCEFNTTDEVSRALTKSKTLMGRSVVSVEPVSRQDMLSALGVVIARHAQEHEFEEYEAPERLPYQEYPRPGFRFPPRGRGFPHFPPRGRGRGGFRVRHHAPTEMELESQNVNAFGKPGCVLALENIPFRAEVQDILDFFKGYFIGRDNVIRRFDENGKPTGDARVCFNSPEDTNHALKVLNHKQIYNRQIHLSLV